VAAGAEPAEPVFAVVVVHEVLLAAGLALAVAAAQDRSKESKFWKGR